jgi:hypothetical protein
MNRNYKKTVILYTLEKCFLGKKLYVPCVKVINNNNNNFIEQIHSYEASSSSGSRENLCIL